MTKEEALAKLREIKAGESISDSDYSSPELAHFEADEVLCQLLKSLGCADVVEAFRDVFKWYA